MRKLIQTIQNIWKIEDLKNRILMTLAFIAIYRFGSFVVIPGVDPSQLAALQAQSADGLLGLLNMFTGGAFSQASIFALGIMPYISASIVIQLLGMAIPYFQKLQREGESGRRKINNITRYLTIVITGGQAPGYIANLKNTLPETAFLLGESAFWLSSIIILVTGTLFVMWLGEKITDGGVGNGISLLIMIGIIAVLPSSLSSEFAMALNAQSGGLVIFLLEMVILVVVIALCILLVQGTRRIPVQYAKRVVGNKQYGGVRQFIPLKVNAAGVMPIIFAQAIMFVPVTLAGFSDDLTGIASTLSDFTGFWYNFLFFLLVVVFTYFYTAITVNPKQMAEDMKRNGGFIPGVKPGRKTAEYLDNIMSRITLPGSLYLGVIAILPGIALNLKPDMTPQFAQFFGGTSLLIMVGVVLDTLQQIESHLLMRHYDGLMEKGKIKGKSSGSMM